MPAKDYVIISAPTLDELQHKVQEFIGRREDIGWQPVGSPVFHPEASGSWHQAMVEISD